MSMAFRLETMTKAFQMIDCHIGRGLELSQDSKSARTAFSLAAYHLDACIGFERKLAECYVGGVPDVKAQNLLLRYMCLMLREAEFCTIHGYLNLWKTGP